MNVVSLIWVAILFGNLGNLCNLWWQWAIRCRIDKIEAQLERLLLDLVMDKVMIGQLMLHSLIPNEKQENSVE